MQLEVFLLYFHLLGSTFCFFDICEYKNPILLYTFICIKGWEMYAARIYRLIGKFGYLNLRWKNISNPMVIPSIRPNIPQNAQFSDWNGRLTFIPYIPVTTVRGSIMVEK